jgi:glycosyltransferase involved in cell wall biosynthesis
LQESTAHPLVSICIPTYNGGGWIAECISSALNQTYEPLEILIVDDGSTDNTVEIARSMRDRRVRLVLNSTHRGLVGNWNECVRLAQGEFIKFLFQDDSFYPHCIETMMRVFAAHPHLGLVFARRDFVVEADAPAELAREIVADYSDQQLKFEDVQAINNGRALFAQHVAKELYQSCIAEPPSTLIRKEVFQRLGLFNTRMHQACDIEMWLRIMFHYDLGFVDEKLLIFRVHGKSATASNRSNRKAEYDRFWMLEGLLSYPEIKNAYPEITKWRDDLLQRYRKARIRPTAGWRSIRTKDGLREAVRDFWEMPGRLGILKEADGTGEGHPPLHPRLEGA